MPDALFEVLDGDRYLPTGLSLGPWAPGALHGGPVALLVSRAAEQALAASGSPARLPVRLTLDLERPVLTTPLTVTTDIVRTGGKVQVAEVTVADDGGRRLARATVLAIRRRPIERPADLIVPDDPILPAPPEAPASWDGWTFPPIPVAFHQNATEHRLTSGSLGAFGPVVDWISLAVPVVAGEEPTPFQRVAAASDFLNGVSAVLSADDWLFINPDLTITLHRLPVGDRVAVAASTRVDADGTGTAEADLFDRDGRIGRAVQTLLIEPR